MGVSTMPKLVCVTTIGGIDTLRTIATSPNLDQCASALKSLPGIGKPFLFFASLPSNPTLADFDLHPDWAGFGNLVTSDTSHNRAMIDAMLADPPMDAITL